MKHGRGYVYDLYYHIVWCVKYRHKILINEVKDDFIDIITNICKNNNYELIEINTDMDHVHILFRIITSGFYSCGYENPKGSFS